MRLEAAIEGARATPFAWGESDCCLFAADCVKAITGIDLAAAYRGQYQSRRGAFSALKRIGNGGVEAAARAALSDPLSSPYLAKRGDVVLMTQKEGPALGICVGERCAYKGPSGVVFHPLSSVQAAWRV